MSNRLVEKVEKLSNRVGELEKDSHPPVNFDEFFEAIKLRIEGLEKEIETLKKAKK